MSARIVLADSEWLISELSVDEVARLVQAGEMVAASRTGKRILVNPAHIVFVEEWTAPPTVSG